MTAAVVGIVACGEQQELPTGPELPEAPQILPGINVQGGTVVFDLTTTSETTELAILLVNGGREDLTVSALSIAGRDADAFTLGDVPDADRTVASEDGLSVPVRFAPSASGVQLATLNVESNAENFANLELQLVGLSPGASVPDAPVLAPFETTVTVEGSTSAPTEVFVRYANIGGGALNVSDYELTGSQADAFEFATGLAQPGVDCESNEACGAGLTCTAEDVCSPVFVPPGSTVVLTLLYAPQAAGSHAATLTLHSDDPESAETKISIEGTAP